MLNALRLLQARPWSYYRILPQEAMFGSSTSGSDRPCSSDTYEERPSSSDEKLRLVEGLEHEESQRETYSYGVLSHTRRRMTLRRWTLMALATLSTIAALTLFVVWWIKVRQDLIRPEPQASTSKPQPPLIGPEQVTPYSTKFGIIRSLQPLLIHEPLLDNQGAGLDSWLTHGDISAKLEIDTSASSSFDTLTFWVNGSDPRHSLARAHMSRNPKQRLTVPGFAAELSQPESLTHPRRDILQNDPNRFRDNGELLYHLRSVRHFVEGLRTQHLVATDFGPQQSPEAGPDGDYERLSSDWFSIEADQGRRQGQVPEWMDLDSGTVAHGDQAKSIAWDGEGEAPMLKLHHDWNVAVPIGRNAAKNDLQLLAWKASRLPSFNSMALEALLGLHVPGLSEVFVYSNDDMFHNRELSAGDFFHPLYGPMIHVNVDYLVPPNAKPYQGIEASGLERSAWMLNRRFGSRKGYPYPIHISKPFYRPIVHEARLMWPEAFEAATAERFRASGVQAQNHMLVFGLLMERHREALLWSFLVAKIDSDGDGMIRGREIGQALKELGDPKGTGDAVVHVAPARRDSAQGSHFDDQTRRIRFPPPRASSITFTSMDGYHGTTPNFEYFTSNEFPAPPRVVKTKDSQKPYCTINLSLCWPWRGPVEADKVFTYFAFENPQCGDCTILHLVNRSGKLGLAAFFPAPGLRMPVAPATSAASEPVPPHLPLVKDWHSGNFSLAAVAVASDASGASRRLFAQQLVHRYSYSIASAPARFAMLTTPRAANATFKAVEGTAGGLAFLCLNDDMDERSYPRVQKLLHDFFERTWPSAKMRLPFERSDGEA